MLPTPTSGQGRQRTQEVSGSAPLQKYSPWVPASLNKQRQALHLALNMWLWGRFLETDMGPCLPGQQLSPVPHDRKLLPSVCRSGSQNAQDWGPILSPHPLATPHPIPSGGDPAGPHNKNSGPSKHPATRTA